MIHLLLLLFISIQAIGTTYSIADYMDFLESKQPFLNQQKAIIGASISQYNQVNALTDWTMTHSLYSNHVTPYQTSSFSPSKINTLGANFNFNRSFLETGGTLSFSINHSKLMQDSIVYNGITFGEPLFFENDISLSYTQPLLYGYGGSALNIGRIQASSNAQITTIDAIEQYETFLLSELTSYIDWFLQYELTELSYARLQLARESLNQTKQRVQVNLAEQIDLLRSEDAVQRAHQQWLTQKAILKSFQFKLASRTDDPSILSKVPSYDLYETVSIKKPEYVVVDQLRIPQIAHLAKRPIESQLELSKTKRYGELNLISTYSFIGGDTTFSDSMAYTANNSSVYLNYSRALGDTQTIESIKYNEKSLEQINYRYDQINQDLQAEIRSLYVLIEEYIMILDVNLNQIITAQKKADAEANRYKQGRSSTDLVIQAQDSVLNAKLNYAHSSAQYHKYVLTYQALIDELLSQYSITL